MSADAESRVLEVIEASGPIRQAAIERLLGVDELWLVPVLKRLRHLGLIRKRWGGYWYYAGG